jgi:hypothetical protein
MLEVKDIQKYNKKSLPQLLKDSTTIFNAWIRDRDRLKDIGDGQWYYCPTCRKQKRIIGNNYQACHCFPAGFYSWHRFNPLNVFGGCKQCNYFKHGTNYEYNDWVRKKIGEESYQKLLTDNDYYKRVGWRWERFSLIEVITTYKQLLHR